MYTAPLEKHWHTFKPYLSRLYLQEELTAIAKQRSNFDVSDKRPCDKDLVSLTMKSS